MKRQECQMKSWQEYEAGKAYKRKIGLYGTVRENERFYRGDQWQESTGKDLPKPVFNVIRRVTDYLIGSVARADYAIRYTDESLPLRDGERGEVLKATLKTLSGAAEALWENGRMDRLIYQLLTDAALSGDGVLFCRWDPDKKTGQNYCGEIVTETVDSTSVFVADVNRADIQSQEYVILSGRESAEKLRREAIAHGLSPEEAERIRPDGEYGEGAGALSLYELSDGEGDKVTYLLKFWKENGEVHFEKSTRSCIIRRGNLGCRLYPIAYFNWYPTKNSFHGTAPVTGLIPNQRYINRAYGMAMKHMQDTAFSKVIYDQSRIPEWSNAVGEAIAAHGGGSMADAVSVVGVGQMQEGYLELIAQALSDTKELMGATDTALGDVAAQNTSAILALQESAQIPLRSVRAAFVRCLEDLGDIWADMMCTYYPKERRLIVREEGGYAVRTADLSVLRDEILSARVDATEITRYSAAAAQNLLDRLLNGGYLTPVEYLKRLPSAAIADKNALIAYLERSAQNDKSTEVGNE